MPVPVVLWMHWSHCAKASSIANHTDGTRQYRTIHHLQIKMVRSFQGPDQTQPDKWSRITWFQSFPKSEVTAVPSAGHKSSKRTGPTCNRRKWCDWLFECSMVWSCPSSFKRAPLTPLVRDLLVESRTWSRIARDFQNSGKGAGNVCSCVLQGSDIEHTTVRIQSAILISVSFTKMLFGDTPFISFYWNTPVKFWYSIQWQVTSAFRVFHELQLLLWLKRGSSSVELAASYVSYVSYVHDIYRCGEEFTVWILVLFSQSWVMDGWWLSLTISFTSTSTCAANQDWGQRVTFHIRRCSTGILYTCD